MSRGEIGYESYKTTADIMGEHPTRDFSRDRSRQTPDMSSHGAPESRTPQDHTAKTYASCCLETFKRCVPGFSRCLGRSAREGQSRNVPEEIELSTLSQEQHVRIDSRVEQQFLRQRTKYLTTIDELLNGKQRVTWQNLTKVASTISEMAQWAEENHIHLNNPSTDYEQAKSHFEAQAEYAGTQFSDALTNTALDFSASTSAGEKTNIINNFNTAARPFLQRLQTRLQPSSQEAGPSWSIE